MRAESQVTETNRKRLREHDAARMHVEQVVFDLVAHAVDGLAHGTDNQMIHLEQAPGTESNLGRIRRPIDHLVLVHRIEQAGAMEVGADDLGHARFGLRHVGVPFERRDRDRHGAFDAVDDLDTQFGRCGRGKQRSEQ